MSAERGFVHHGLDCTTCRACAEPIAMLPHWRTGTKAPITLARYADGNIEIDLTSRTYRIIPPESRQTFREGLHKNHFANCPDAPKFARKGKPR